MLNIVLTTPPPLNRIYRTAAGRIYKTNEAKNWEEEAAWEIKLSAKKKKYDGLVGVTVTQFPPDNRKRDIDGPIKLLLDAIEKSGVINDDYQINKLIIERRPKAEQPRIELKIWSTESAKT